MVLKSDNLFFFYNFVVNSKTQILNVSYAVILKPQILTFQSCSLQTPNMLPFLKSQTPNIDMDPRIEK